MEFARLAEPRLILVMLLGALVNAAAFAAFTFLAGSCPTAALDIGAAAGPLVAATTLTTPAALLIAFPPRTMIAPGRRTTEVRR